MIICLCNRVSERDIEHAVRSGTHCFERLKDATGVASTCGCCHDCARESFDAARSRHGCGVAQTTASVSASANPLVG